MRSPSVRVARPRTALRAGAGLLLASLVLTGCGGTEKKVEDSTDAAKKTTDGQILHKYWPMTGLNADNATTSRPPIVVKLDNTPASQPQVGLNRADLITEELVEGGLTRLAAFFDTHVPGEVGPVRSMRASDIGVVKPVDAVVVTSGAAAPTYPRLKRAGVKYYAEDTGGVRGFSRSTARRAPYNLMVDLKQLARQVKPPADAPKPYLDWGTSADFPGSAAGTRIDARFSPGHTTRWAFRGGKYVNTNSNASPGQQFRPDTVVVVRVKEGNAGYLDPAGNPVPETIYRGTGSAVVFHGGKAVRATWSKSGATGILTLRTKAGALKVPAGHTWIELLPTAKSGGNLSFS